MARTDRFDLGLDQWQQINRVALNGVDITPALSRAYPAVDSEHHTVSLNLTLRGDADEGFPAEAAALRRIVAEEPPYVTAKTEEMQAEEWTLKLLP